jgi:hypothetical protein
METHRTQMSDTGAELRPLYLSDCDPDDESDAREVDDGPEQLAA